MHARSLARRRLSFEHLEDRQMLSITPLAGDYSGNNSVGAEDRTIWVSTFNSTTDLRADGNNDGVVDAADFTVYRDNFGGTRPSTPFLNLVVDTLDESRESTPGAIIFRNSDFSKQVLAASQPEAGLPLYIPDYQTGSTVVDPQAVDDFTTGSVRIDTSMLTTHKLRFNFPANVRLWTTTNWVGMVNVGGGRFQIPSTVDITPAAVHLDFQIEGLTSSTSFAADSIFAFAQPTGGGATLSDAVFYTVVDTGIGVDGNRDTAIDFANSHDRQLLFWLNNDQEGQHPSDTAAEYEKPLITTPDNVGNLLSQRRDLEDLAPLRLKIDPLLVTNSFNSGGVGTPGANQLLATYNLRLKDSGGAALRFFKAASNTADVTQHVNNTGVANLQTGSALFKDSDFPSVTSVGQNVPIVFTSGLTPFLFEAIGGSYGSNFTANPILVLTTTITYGNGQKTSFEQEVVLDLRDIKQLYTRWDINYGVNGGATGVDLRKDPDFRHFATPTTPTHQSQVTNKTYWNSNETVVFVHGWNNLDRPIEDDKAATAETLLKRLYWQGFRGEFVAFNWPTFADREGVVNFFNLAESSEWLSLSYNPSEFQAYRSAQALKEILESYRGTAPNLNPVHLLAHSMGNVVAGEAMRQWAQDPLTEDALVTNYVAMEAAISAGAWSDNGTDSRISGRPITDFNRFWSHGRDGFADNSLGVITFLSGASFSAEKMINLYNEEDYALSWWDWNNFSKGVFIDSNEDVQSTVWPFGYEFVEGLGENTNTDLFFRTEFNQFPDSLVLTDPNGSPGPNAYEIMAFYATSASLPLGRKPVNLFDTNIDITTYGLPLANNILVNHSYQFAHDAAATWQFYSDLKVETGFLSTYGNPPPIVPTSRLAIEARDVVFMYLGESENVNDQSDDGGELVVTQRLALPDVRLLQQFDVATGDSQSDLSEVPAVRKRVPRDVPLKLNHRSLTSIASN